MKSLQDFIKNTKTTIFDPYKIYSLTSGIIFPTVNGKIEWGNCTWSNDASLEYSGSVNIYDVDAEINRIIKDYEIPYNPYAIFCAPDNKIAVYFIIEPLLQYNRDNEEQWYDMIMNKLKKKYNVIGPDLGDGPYNTGVKMYWIK